ARAAADGFASRADAATHWFQSRAALAAARWQDAGEIVAAHKAAAVTASALALAGGSAATVATLPHRAGRRTAEHGAQHGNPAVRLHEATSASPHGAGAPAAQHRFVSQTGPAPRTRSPAPPPRTAPANTASPRSSAGASPSGRGRFLVAGRQLRARTRLRTTAVRGSAAEQQRGRRVRSLAPVPSAD